MRPDGLLAERVICGVLVDGVVTRVTNVVWGRARSWLVIGRG